MKKKQRNYWKIALISILIFFGILFIIFLFSQNNTPTYEWASQGWENHRTIINNDEGLISQYLQEYKSVQSASDISYINAKLAPRLDIYDAHLIESRNFLNQYSYLFTNGAELKAQIDDKIVASQTIRNNINVLVEEYNQAVEEYNRKIQEYSNLFKLLI